MWEGQIIWKSSPTYWVTSQQGGSFFFKFLWPCGNIWILDWLQRKAAETSSEMVSPSSSVKISVDFFSLSLSTDTHFRPRNEWSKNKWMGGFCLLGWTEPVPHNEMSVFGVTGFNVPMANQNSNIYLIRTWAIWDIQRLISEIFFNLMKFWVGLMGPPLSAPKTPGVTPNAFLSPLKHM